MTNRFLVITALLLLFCSSPIWSDGIDIFNQGYDAHVSGDQKTAIRFYRQAIDSNEITESRLAYVYHYYALAHYELSEFDQSLTLFDTAIKLDADIDISYPLRGNVHSILGNFQLAINDYNRALEKTKDDIQVLNNRGYAWYLLGNYDKAIADYDTAILINPEQANTYFNRALAQFENKNFDSVLADVGTVLKQNPDDADALSIRGFSYLALGQHDKSQQDFDAAIALDPAKYSFFLGRGKVLHQQKKFEQAISDFNQALQLSAENIEIYQARAETLLAMGNNDMAQQDLAKIDVALAKTEIEQTKKVQAQSDIDSTDSDPGIYTPQAAIQTSLNQQADTPAAVTELSSSDIEGYKKRGWNYYHRMEFVAAQRDFEKVISLKPADIYRILAVYISAAHAGSNPKQAIQPYIENGVSARWPGVIIDYFLGNDSQESVIHQATQVGSRKSLERLCEAYYYLAELYLLSDDLKNARHYFQKAIDTGIDDFNEYLSAKIQLERLDKL